MLWALDRCLILLEKTMSPTHHHNLHHDTTGRRLLLTLLLNVIIPTVQIIGGLLANSMALISDASHNFSDSLSLFIAYITNRMSKREATLTHTFGYHRAEIIAAVVNVGLLVAASAFIVYEASRRIMTPETVSGRLVLILATVGIAGNGFSAWLLHHDAHNNLNVRSAFLHMLGDLFTSVVVAVNGLLLMFTQIYWLDPLLSIGIALFILKNCWAIVKEAVNILMNATPASLDLHAVKDALEQLPEVKNVHYIHAWQISTVQTAFSCHVVLQEDQPVSNTEKLIAGIAALLASKFDIHHPVIQFETTPCGNGDLLCGMPQCGIGRAF